jgi:hypothetical protein
MSLSLIVTAVDHRTASTPVREASASLLQDDLSIHCEPPASPPTIVEGGAAVRSASPPHCRRAAAMIRQLSGRTEAVLRRELDRFFAGRPDLSRADRAAIARAMARFRNQLLHHPRATLRAAAADDDLAAAAIRLDAVSRLLGLADATHAHRCEHRIPANRTTRSSSSSVAP